MFLSARVEVVPSTRVEAVPSTRVEAAYQRRAARAASPPDAGARPGTVDRRPGISWDLACQDHEKRGALGGPDEFGVVEDGVYPQRPAGAAHLHMAVYGQVFGGPPVVTPHYPIQTKGYTEEEKRLFLLTGERKRRGYHIRQARTRTIPGLGE